MSDRPSDGMRFDELREEFDWISEFQSNMAERIRGDADVHSLAGYVNKIEAENAKLRELVHDMCEWAYIDSYCDLDSRFADRMRELGIKVEG